MDLFLPHQPNADCMDDLPTDFEGSLGGPPTNQITGASDTTVNESSVTLDPAVRTVGALQVAQDPDPTPQEGEVIFSTNSKSARSCRVQKGYLLPYGSWKKTHFLKRTKKKCQVKQLHVRPLEVQLFPEPEGQRAHLALPCLPAHGHQLHTPLLPGAGKVAGPASRMGGR